MRRGPPTPAERPGAQGPLGLGRLLPGRADAGEQIQKVDLHEGCYIMSDFI
jgi:hypothetical protein